jgi:peptide/nickel transport system substrate-binding protein
LAAIPSRDMSRRSNVRPGPARIFRRFPALLALSGALLGLACGHRRAGPRSHLTVVQSSDILTLDPNEKFEVVNDTVAMNIFDPLLRFDRHMTLQPALASRWENPNDRTWRFHIRPGVAFHDGGRLTAQDVVFTIQRVMSRPESEVHPFLAGIQSVRAIGDSVVEITTSAPTALLSRLAVVYILPRRVFETRGEKGFLEHPIGTGPYRFVSWARGRAIDLEANARYWGGTPPISRVTFRSAITDEEQWRLAGSPTPTILLEAPRRGWEAEGRTGALQLVARPGLAVSYIGINVAPRPNNPFADIRVRRALRLAIDLHRLLAVGAGGHGYPASQYVPPDVIGYDPSLAVPDADPAAARNLLREAGHPDGLDIVVDVERGDGHSLEDELGTELQAAGFRMKTRDWPKVEFYDRIDRGLSPLHLAAWICTSGESAEFFETSLHTRDPASGLGRDNGFSYSNAELDRTIEQLMATIDPLRRLDLEKKAMKTAMRDLPLIPLAIQEDRYAMSAGIVWEPRADGEIFLPGVALR